MLTDALSLPDAHVVETDVCIIGAGPGGITAAREFLGHRLTVAVLEAGRFEHNDPIQDVAGDCAPPQGDLYPGAQWMRSRQYAGTAQQWGIDMSGRQPVRKTPVTSAMVAHAPKGTETQDQQGVRYVPLDPIDFERRDWLPHSGWPITKADLDPYYERAHATGQSGRYDYNPDHWADAQAKPWAFAGGRLTSHMFHFGLRDVFVHDYRQQIEASANVTLYLNASVVALETDATGQHVTHARVRQFDGREQHFRAKRFILAVGGLETPRLLLLSNRVHANGLGNQHDMVGRFLMDHPLVRSGYFVTEDRSVLRKLGFYDTRWIDGKMVIAKPVISEDVMRREQLMNTTAVLFPRVGNKGSDPLRWFFKRGPRFRSPAVASARELSMSLKQGKLPPGLLGHVGNLLGGLDDMLFYWWRKNQAIVHHHCPCAHWKNRGVLHQYGLDHGGWSRLPDLEQQFGCIEMLHMTEQAPDPDNRVVLGDRLDALGSRRIQLHWRWTDLDIRSARRAQEIYAEDLSRSGLGRFVMQRDRDVPTILLPSVHHHMGTARMHSDPRQGVVDADNRIHGVSNTFIASSATFTTGGFANSTLTIMAFAIRVADKVKAELATA
ncbi:MAG: GMC family oxidoreductase [Rubrivivax sp.]|jgi:choline dehydrogenase-like flavoprotein|nr:GMC family oxidoreductase [Rubrivivax sp.]